MISKRQILDVCNKLFADDKEKYFYSRVPQRVNFNYTLMANDLVFQLAINESEYETALRGVHEWWSESTYNPEGKKFKA
jgi:hypothetical protein